MLFAESVLGRVLPELVKLPESATEVTAAVTVSLVSRSLTVSEPLLLRVVSVSVRAATSPLDVSVAYTSGESLVPVMVIVTVLDPLSGVLSSSVAVIV